MPKIYNRICNQCNKPYTGQGSRFCSIPCFQQWFKEQKPLEKRFWSKVQITDLFSCWTWVACRNKDGYGIMQINNKSTLAHRTAWELCNGPIPARTCVLHKCDNRSCINPSHLFLGSQQDNITDMMNKGRHVASKGEHSGVSKLTEKDVLAIRSLKQQRITNESIAAKFGISQSTVYKIASRATWKCI